jgi:hypothetical protein
MKSLLRRVRQKYARFRHLVRSPSVQIETNAILLAELHIARIRELGVVGSLRDVEMKVFSQFGEDGIIQYLINRIPIDTDTFIEFGVEDYVESNTRFLLKHDNWRGLVIDGNAASVEAIREDRVSVYHDLTSVCAFVTRENIDGLIRGAGLAGDIGLLSIDIDGNEYWVWKAITAVSPRIVVCEYNSLFGPEAAVTIPYAPDFDYNRAHHSRLYFGASLAALCSLAEEKGYDFAGTNSAGHNAFFVRKDVSQFVRTFTAKEGYVECRFRESFGLRREKTFLSGKNRIRAIMDLPVHDVGTGGVKPIREALGDDFFL